MAICEEIEKYRQEVRPKLRAWLESVRGRPNQQLIVIIAENAARGLDSSRSGRAFLLDKVRFDFGDKALLKLVHLKIHPEEVLSGTADFIDAVSDCVYFSVSSTLAQLEDDVKKVEMQKDMSDWNYCNYFALKENKASINYKIGRLAQSLACYDELEVALHEVLGSVEYSGLPSGFGSFLPNGSETVCYSPILELKESLAREKILQNEISVYELGVYIFIRQIKISFEAKNFPEFFHRARRFLCFFISRPFSDKIDRKRWIFGQTFAILKYFEHNIASLDESDVGIKVLVVDLLLLSEFQLSCQEVDFAQTTSTFTFQNFNSTPSWSELMESGDSCPFRVSLLEYCSSADCFQQHSSTLVSVLTRLGNLYRMFKNYQKAIESYEKLLDSLVNLSWNDIRLSVLSNLIICYWESKDFQKCLKTIVDLSQFRTLSNESVFASMLDKISMEPLDFASVEFERFFSVVSIGEPKWLDHKLSVSVYIKPFLNISAEDVIFSMRLVGEVDDITITSETFSIDDKNVICASFCYENISSGGQYKLMEVSAIKGSISFSPSSLEALKDLNFHFNLPLNFDFACLLPEIFDFNNPTFVIRVKAIEHEITNVSVSPVGSGLLFKSSKSAFSNADDHSALAEPIRPNESMEFLYHVDNFLPGTHKAKLIVDYKLPDEVVNRNSQFFEIVFPQKWEIESEFINLPNRSRLLSSYICPSTNDQVSSDIISLDGLNFTDQNGFISSKMFFQSTSSISVCQKSSKDQNELMIKLNQSDAVLRYSLSSVKRCATFQVTPLTNLVEIGDRVQLSVSILEGSAINTAYFIEYDEEDWLICGMSKGTCKSSTWQFHAIPLKEGYISLPKLCLPTDLVKYHNISRGRCIFVKSKLYPKPPKASTPLTTK